MKILDCMVYVTAKRMLVDAGQRPACVEIWIFCQIKLRSAWKLSDVQLLLHAHVRMSPINLTLSTDSKLHQDS